jgi:hypothetical protein
MPRKTNHDQLSESWADVNEPDDDDDDVASVNSEEGFEPRLREAYYNSNAPSASARKRGASQMSGNSAFIMPSPEASVHVQRPSRKSQRQASRPMYTPNRRLPSNPQPERRVRKPSRTARAHEPDNYIHAIWLNLALPLLNYVLSIFSFAARLLKPLLGYALIVLFLAAGFGIAKTMLVHSLSNALAPLCNIPGAGYLNMPFCGITHYAETRGTPEFDKLVITQSTFEDVLQNSVNHAALPAVMKHSEIAVRDLRTSVKYSNLAKRNELMAEFDGFVQTAKLASDGLSKFNSRISRALDGIVTTNRWTMKILEAIQATPHSDGIVPTFFNKYLSALHLALPQQDPADVIYDRYVRHTIEVDDQIQLCISEANHLIGILDNLDERLNQIGQLAHQEGVRVGDSKAELLGILWTKLGANRAVLAKHEAQLNTLNEVTTYRATALHHVSTTLIKLKDIGNNLHRLRDDIAAPSIVGRQNMPLEMHITLITSAVERLEAVRDEGRRETDRMLRAGSDQGDGNKRKKVIGL